MKIGESNMSIKNLVIAIAVVDTDILLAPAIVATHPGLGQLGVLSMSLLSFAGVEK